MSQMSLFGTQKSEPAAVDIAYVRKHLRGLLRTAKVAEILPWSRVDTAKWERMFPALAKELPAEEGDALAAEFAAQLARLRASDNGA
jgi:hypothetical protein